MLTKNEAQDRAARIWGKRFEFVMQVKYSPGEWYVELRDCELGHALDGNGHVACGHAECQRLEAQLP